MDSVDLIARENEFKKLNKQLEKKTESLMKEIELVMQKQDIFSEFGHLNTNQYKKHTERKSPQHEKMPQNCCKPKEIRTNNKKSQEKKPETSREQNCGTDNGVAVDEEQLYGKRQYCLPVPCDCRSRMKMSDLDFLYAFVTVNVKDNVLPKSFMKDAPTLESVCKFLSAKVKLMQEQLDRSQSTIDKKAKQCEAHLGQLAGLESERLTLLNAANTIKADAADTRAKCAVLQHKLNEKERQYKEQRSMSDRITSEVKQLRSKNASLEARCASHDEVVTTLKQQLENCKKSEKEFRESTRTLSNSHQAAITRLESRIKHLKAHGNKQSSLIDNLKRQNALLTTEGCLKALEKEYSDFLNQDL